MRKENEIENEIRIYISICFNQIKKKEFEKAAESLNRINALLWVLNLKEDDFIK